IRSLRKTQHLGLLLRREQRNPSRPFNLVLPPPDQAVMLRGCSLVQPQRILRYRIRRQLARKSMCAQELVHRLKRDFQWPQPKRREAAQVHADVDELVVAKFYSTG